MSIDLKKSKQSVKQADEVLRLQEGYSEKLLKLQNLNDEILKTVGNFSDVSLETIFAKMNKLTQPDILTRDKDCLVSKTNQESYDALLNYDAKPFHKAIQSFFIENAWIGDVEKFINTGRLSYQVKPTYYSHYSGSKCKYDGLDKLTYDKLKVEILPDGILELERILGKEAREFTNLLSLSNKVNAMKNLYQEIQKMDSRNEETKGDAKVDSDTMSKIKDYANIKIANIIPESLWKFLGFPMKTKDVVEQDSKNGAQKTELSSFFSSWFSAKTEAVAKPSEVKKSDHTSVNIYLNPEEHLSSDGMSDVGRKLNHQEALDAIHTNNQAVAGYWMAHAKTTCFSTPIMFSTEHTKLCIENRVKEMMGKNAEYYSAKVSAEGSSTSLMAVDNGGAVAVSDSAKSKKSAAETCEEIRVKIDQYLENCNYIYSEDSTADQSIQDLIEKSVSNSVVQSEDGSVSIEVGGLSITFTGSTVEQFNQSDVDDVFHSNQLEHSSQALLG